jgi:hypothetical protein
MKWLRTFAVASLMTCCARSKPSDACVSYCACMEERCHGIPGYPYPDRGSCLGRCAVFNSVELYCWSRWCTDVTTQPDIVGHLCEHAWGRYALDECEPQ